MKPTYTLFDSSFLPFGNNSLSLGGERCGEHPVSFEWRSVRQPGTVFYTDIRLSECKPKSNVLNVALIVEPWWKPSHYEYARAYSDRFDYILSHRHNYFPEKKFLYYPHGGSWIKPEHHLLTSENKRKLISLIVSEKIAASGHQLRREIANAIPNIDLYGRGTARPMTSKTEALDNYYYQIVVESQSYESYFTEKVIDCFTQRVIPIYNGDFTFCEHFDCNGIWRFETVEELRSILANISDTDYFSRLASIDRNQELAAQYFCAEDWIFAHYPFLFQR